MSEEKIDLKKLTRTQAIDAFFEGKVSKKELEDVLDKKDLFKLKFKDLENVLYNQKKSPKMFPKKMRIKSDDIVKEYGRTLSGGQLIRLADKDYISETELLKALGKTDLLKFLSDGEVEQEADEIKLPIMLGEETKKEEKSSQEASSDEKENETQEFDFELENSEDVLLTKQMADEFFSAKKLTEMYFSQKMTKEFTETYQETFKDNPEVTERKSRAIIDELRIIFENNLHALYIAMIRLHMKGFITGHDAITDIDIEFFKEKAFKDSGLCEVLDKDGNVLYSFKQTEEPEVILPAADEDQTIEESQETESEQEEENAQETSDDIIEMDDEESQISETEEVEETLPETEDYPVIEPLTEEELIEAFRDEFIDSEVFKRFFTMSELIHMYKTRKLPVKVFALIEEDKRVDEIIKAYDEDNIHLEGIMELYFYYNAITTKGLSRIIKNLPKRISLLRYISVDTSIDKIYELYEYGLIDFNILTLLKDQGFISEETFNKIRLYVDKVSFYESIKNKEFYTNKCVEPEENVQTESEKETQEQVNLVEMSDQERVLLSKVVGITDEELENVSIIRSEDEEGNKTSLDGYQIISDSKDGLVIFGKFDYSSPIFVMTYEEAAYFFRTRDEEDLAYIYDDLAHRERFENNSQIVIVEHDENMGTKLLEALSLLSLEARERYSDDEKYLEEVKEYIRQIDEKYKELTENNY